QKPCVFTSHIFCTSLPHAQVHLQEEAILARATGFAADETLRLPPRHPGQGLHQSLIDVARAQEKQDRRT
ncbi:unnamed protein product, partial [Sphacelaria rigidula]